MVNIEFENGATASHSLTGLAAKGNRTIDVYGTRGEVKADIGKGELTLHTFGSDNPVHVDVAREGDEAITHGHLGDAELVSDFVDAIAEGRTDVKTSITDSLKGHLIAFAADQAIRENRVVNLEKNILCGYLH